MECLICYKVYFEDFEKDSNLSSTFCKLLGISELLFSDYFNSSICIQCHSKLFEVDTMLKELELIQTKVSQIKKEIVDDLMKSHKLSEENGKELVERNKIVKELTSIATKLEHPDDINPHELVQIKLEVDQDQDDQDATTLQDDYFEGSGSGSYSNSDGEVPNPSKKSKSSGGSSSSANLKKKLKRLKKEKEKKKKLKFNKKRSAKDIPAEKKKRKKRKLKEAAREENMDLDDGEEGNEDFSSLIDFLESSGGGGNNGNSKERPHCHLCNKYFSKKSFLIIHLRKHTGELPFVCEHCGKAFRAARYLKSHLKYHGIGKDITTCEICGIYLTSKRRAEEHMKVVHEGVRSFLCEFCTQSFSAKKTLDEHRLAKHFGQKFVCLQCSQEFESTSVLNHHIKRDHEKAFKHFCPIPECNKGFVIKSAMEYHLKSSHLKETKFNCEICNAGYYQKNKLDQHMRAKHTMERPYPCTFCQKGFVSKALQLNHEKLHLGVRDFVCNYCGEAYAVKTSLDSHVREIHLHPENHFKDPNNRRKFMRVTRVPVVDPAIIAAMRANAMNNGETNVSLGITEHNLMNNVSNMNMNMSHASNMSHMSNMSTMSSVSDVSGDVKEMTNPNPNRID